MSEMARDGGAARAEAAGDGKDEEAGSGGNGLLWLLGAVAAGFALWRPRPGAEWIALVDWQTVGALAGLLAITQAVERSGVLQVGARRLLARVTSQRRLTTWLVAGAAALSALVTNDVSLFLLVPLTRALAAQASLPLSRLVVLEALAVNAGSALTPIGNPQNLFLWHRSGTGIAEFTAMMLPTVAAMLACLWAAVRLLVPDQPIRVRADAPHGETSPALLWLAVALLAAFVVALDRQRLVVGLAIVFATLLWRAPRALRGIDWPLLAIIALMFVDLRQLADVPAVDQLMRSLPIDHGIRAYLAAIATSQLISNVPAAILLDRYVHDLPALAAGVSVGGFGSVVGSLANLIALRLARLPHGLRDYHRVAVPFLIVCAAVVAAVRAVAW